MKAISKRNFKLDGEAYQVLKFLYDDPNSEDEEQMYFYCRSVGIIIYKSESWGGFGRIFKVANSEEKTRIALLLGDKIIEDSIFFDSWRE